MISSAASTMALKMGMTASMATLWMASKGPLKGRLSMGKEGRHKQDKRQTVTLKGNSKQDKKQAVGLAS